MPPNRPRDRRLDATLRLSPHGKTDFATPSERTTLYRYDTEGNRTHIVYNYDNYFEPGGGYDPGNDGTAQDIAYETKYNKYGERSAEIDAKGHHTWFQYDDFGILLRKVLDADGDGLDPGLDGNPELGDIYEEYTYDQARELLLSMRNYDGGVIEYRYHPLTDRKTNEAYPDGYEIAYEYDSQGRLSSVAETKGAVTRTTVIDYDPVADQPSRIAKPEGTLNYSYNELGSLTRVYESAGSGVDYEYYYDEAGRLIVVNTPSGQTQYEYEEWGSRKSQTLPNGVFTKYQYDNLLRTDRIAHYENSGENPNDLLAEFDYTVGQTGKRLAVKETINEAVVNIVYTYDGLGRLTNSDRDDIDSYDRSFTYDVVGNRLTKQEGGGGPMTTYEYNPLDQLTKATRSMMETDYTYDGNGNLQTKEEGTKLTTYVYDNRQKLERVYNGNEATGDLFFGYAYDYAGNRVAKVDYSASAAERTAYLIDDNNLTGYSQTFYEYNGNTAQINRLYEYGDDLTGELDLAGASPEDPQFFLYDGLGTTRALTNFTATIQQSFDYLPFGDSLNHPTIPATNHLFSGETYDANLEQYYLRARMYDPTTGRFVSYDPEEDTSNKLHKYLYVGGDPINKVDPTGEEEFTLAGVDMSSIVYAILGTIAVTVLWQPIGQAGAIVLHTVWTQTLATTGSIVAAAATTLAEANTSVKELIEKARNKLKRAGRNWKKVKIVPMPKSLIPKVVANIVGAFTLGKPAILERVSFAQSLKNRIAAIGNRKPAGVLKSWDEYPFASSKQGGKGAKVAKVPSWQNSLQGGIIAGAYISQNIRVKSKYLVVITP